MIEKAFETKVYIGMFGWQVVVFAIWGELHPNTNIPNGGNILIYFKRIQQFKVSRRLQ